MNDILNMAPYISPKRLRDIGFRAGQKGTHSSRTIMLHELTLLLEACPKDAPRDHYLASILHDNCLGKRTDSTRKLVCRQRFW